MEGTTREQVKEQEKKKFNWESASNRFNYLQKFLWGAHHDIVMNIEVIIPKIWYSTDPILTAPDFWQHFDPILSAYSTFVKKNEKGKHSRVYDKKKLGV